MIRMGSSSSTSRNNNIVGASVNNIVGVSVNNIVGASVNNIVGASVNNIVGASVVSGCRTGGQLNVSSEIEDYFTDGARSTEIIKVKSVKVMKRATESISIFHHEFLLIEVQLTACEFRVPVLAEKNYNSESEGGQNVGGVRIGIPIRRSLEGAQTRCAIELRECGEIVAKDLFDDLTEHDLTNSVGMNNCWKYAYDASCKVLERCEKLPDTSPETKAAIRLFSETFLASVETMVRPVLPGETETPALGAVSAVEARPAVVETMRSLLVSEVLPATLRFGAGIVLPYVVSAAKNFVLPVIFPAANIVLPAANIVLPAANIVLPAAANIVRPAMTPAAANIVMMGLAQAATASDVVRGLPTGVTLSQLARTLPTLIATRGAI